MTDNIMSSIQNLGYTLMIAKQKTGSELKFSTFEFFSERFEYLLYLTKTDLVNYLDCASQMGQKFFYNHTLLYANTKSMKPRDETQGNIELLPLTGDDILQISNEFKRITGIMLPTNSITIPNFYNHVAKDMKLVNNLDIIKTIDNYN